MFFACIDVTSINDHVMFIECNKHQKNVIFAKMCHARPQKQRDTFEGGVPHFFNNFEGTPEIRGVPDSVSIVRFRANVAKSYMSAIRNPANLGSGRVFSGISTIISQ